MFREGFLHGVALLLGAFFLKAWLETHVWNSDLFYLEAILRDLRSGAFPLSEFHFSASTFTFPDFPIYSIFRLLGFSLNLTLWSYGFLLVVALGVLLRGWMQRAHGMTSIWMVLFFSVVFESWWYQLFYPVHHGAQWILGVLFLFQMGPLRDQGLPRWVLSALISALFASSDLLFLLNGVMPYCLLLASTWGGSQRRGRMRSDVLWGLLVFVLTLGFYFGFREATGSYFGWNKPLFGESAKAMSFASEFLKFSLQNVMIWGGLIQLMVYARNDLASRYCLLAIITSIFWILLTGGWSGVENSRYVYPIPIGILYVWGRSFQFFIDPSLLSRGLAQRLPKVISIFFVCVLAVFWGFRFEDLSRVRKDEITSDPYPESVQCLDRYAKESGSKVGVGNYWSAKYTSFLSRENVNVLQVDQELQPSFWINNHRWYDDAKPRFLLIDFKNSQGLRQEGVSELGLGSPIEIRNCGDFLIYAYGPEVKLLRSGNELRKFKSLQEFR